jgi:hypothetical protein
MTTFKFQTQFSESSDRLNRAAKLIDLDVSKAHLVIQFDLSGYDSIETSSSLDRHIFKNTQIIEIITDAHKYHMTVTPMIRLSVGDNTEEVQYTVHSHTEE